MSIDTRYLESGARIRPGSPHASPSTGGQSDIPFSQFLSSAESRPSVKPESIAPRVEDKAMLQRRGDESAQARRQIERQRDAKAENKVNAKPAEKTADDAESKQAVSSTDSDPANKPGMSTQRSAENRDLAPKAQGRGPRDPQEAKGPRGPQDADQADASPADATQTAKTRPGAAHHHRGGHSVAGSANTEAAQTPDGTDSATTQAAALQTTDPAQAALTESASTSPEAIEGQGEDGKASTAKKKLTADPADSEAAATTVATIALPIPDAGVAATAQAMVASGSEKGVTGKSETKADKPAIDTATDSGSSAQAEAIGAPASRDAMAASGSGELGASPEAGAKPGRGAAPIAGDTAAANPNANASPNASATLPQALRDAQAADAANAVMASAIDNARPLADNVALSLTGLTGRQETVGPQAPAHAVLTDQAMVPPGSFAALLRSAEGPGESRSEALARPQNFPITVPFDDARFGSALSERVQWLVKEGIQSAELTLHPQDMGPIRIEMSIDGTAASIDFAATQADTRAAIEQSLPRLRDLLADQGLQLGGTQIGADTSRQDNSGNRARQSGGTSRTATVSIPDATTDGVPVNGMPAARRNAAGRIDLFA